MNWFTARIIYRIVTGKGEHAPQFDEQLRLIRARDKASAFEKASRLGHKEQDSFSNHKGETVEWRFVGVAELTHLGTLTDGAELTSSITEPTDAHLYTRYVHERQHAIGAGFLSLNMRSIDN
ncbi:MAG: DUF4288 domain-containing protein [Flavobacteriales bacterium]|nr:DUF4288 domain-containing protein [Flavobacteriales bacterium]MCB9448548.1 DUF4288 domain-containing protein [Flavobacteriales bacterium]